MNALLDLIGSTVIGGILLLSIVTTASFVQAKTNNTQIQIMLGKNVDRFLSKNLDQYYLECVGLDVPSTIPSIITADSTAFEFRGKFDHAGAVLRGFSIIEGTPDGIYIPLIITIDNVVPNDSNFLSMSRQMKITYFDVTETEIAFPISVAMRAQIRSARFDFTFATPGIPVSGSTTIIENSVSIWKYFKNLY